MMFARQICPTVDLKHLAAAERRAATCVESFEREGAGGECKIAIVVCIIDAGVILSSERTISGRETSTGGDYDRVPLVGSPAKWSGTAIPRCAARRFLEAGVAPAKINGAVYFRGANVRRYSPRHY